MTARRIVALALALLLFPLCSARAMPLQEMKSRIEAIRRAPTLSRAAQLIREMPEVKSLMQKGRSQLLVEQYTAGLNTAQPPGRQQVIYRFWVSPSEKGTQFWLQEKSQGWGTSSFLHLRTTSQSDRWREVVPNKGWRRPFSTIREKKLDQLTVITPADLADGLTKLLQTEQHD